MAGNKRANIVGQQILATPPKTYDGSWMERLVASLNSSLTQIAQAISNTTAGGGFYSGTAVPADSTGNQGDFYLQFSTPAVIWGPKVGSWSASQQTTL
jgi:hypothetical protein